MHSRFLRRRRLGSPTAADGETSASIRPVSRWVLETIAPDTGEERDLHV